VNEILIGAVVGAILGGLLLGIFGRQEFGWIGTIFSALLGAIMGALVLGVLGGGITASIVGRNLPQHRVVLSHQELLTLHQATGIEGRYWFLGGSLSDTSKYVYYVQTSSGVERRTVNTDNNVNANNKDPLVYIVFDAPAGTGYIDTLGWTLDNPQDSAWGFAKGDMIMQIHIPPDSIKQDFTVGS
jgi:MFS family permease